MLGLGKTTLAQVITQGKPKVKHGAPCLASGCPRETQQTAIEKRCHPRSQIATWCVGCRRSILFSGQQPCTRVGGWPTVVLKPPKVDIRPPDFGSVHTTDINQQIRQRAVARERHPPSDRVPLRSGHMAIILIGQLLRDQHESRAGINNSLRSRHLGPGAADPKAGRRNLPESPFRVGRDPRQPPYKLGTIDAAKLVGAGGVLAQVDGKKRLGEGRHDVLEEGALLGRLYGTELGEGEAEQPVDVGVRGELGRHGGSHMDGLVCHGAAADIDRVGPHVLRRAGAVAVEG